jgi:hypothetical protein
MENMLGSGYSDAEKEFFYQKEYGSDDNYVYARIGGIPIDENLKLRRDGWTIKGEKDGEGKTVTGSAKAAYLDYVDGLQLTGVQKDMLVMITKNYKMPGEAVKNVYDYVINLDVGEPEKDILLEALGFSQGGEYEDGATGGSPRGGKGKRTKAGGSTTLAKADTILKRIRELEASIAKPSGVPDTPKADFNILKPETWITNRNTGVPKTTDLSVSGPDRILEATKAAEMADAEKSGIYSQMNTRQRNNLLDRIRNLYKN